MRRALLAFALLYAVGARAEESVDALRTALGAEAAATRLTAAAALGALGAKAEVARRELIDRLGDDEPAVRAEAARALVRIGCGKEQALLLLKRLESVDAEIGPLCAEAIAGAGREVVEAVAECPHRFATLALGYMGQEGVHGLPALVDRAGQEFVAESVRRLAPWGAPVVPDLVDRARFGDESVRALAAGVLGKIGPQAKEAIPHLKSILEDGETPESVRAAARTALARIDLAPAREEHPLLRKPEECIEKSPEKFRVLLATTRGEIEIEIVRAWAPHGADRVWNLVRIGYFRDARFFRVMEGFVAQWGIHADSRVSGLWRSRNLPDDPPRGKNLRGTIAFAMAGPETRSTQLFINLRDNPGLDEQSFVPLGRVVRGMERADALFAGHGEEPDQQAIEYSGNAYLRRHFPRLDSIRDARILEE